MTTQVLQTVPGRRSLLLLFGGIVTLLSGAIADAVINSQFDDPEALALAAERPQRIPATIGLWHSTPGTIDLRERQVAAIDGAVRLHYRHSRLGYSVTLTVLCGAAGPMSVHPPTACFEGVGYTLASEPRVVSLTDQDGHSITLNRASFVQTESGLTEQVRVFWGWSLAGDWEAPANPRLTWRGMPSLYKLYVVDRCPGSESDLPQAEVFLEEALPAIRQALSGSDTVRRDE